MKIKDLVKWKSLKQEKEEILQAISGQIAISLDDIKDQTASLKIQSERREGHQFSQFQADYCRYAIKQSQENLDRLGKLFSLLLRVQEATLAEELYEIEFSDLLFR